MAETERTLAKWNPEPDEFLDQESLDDLRASYREDYRWVLEEVRDWIADALARLGDAEADDRLGLKIRQLREATAGRTEPEIETARRLADRLEARRRGRAPARRHGAQEARANHGPGLSSVPAAGRLGHYWARGPYGNTGSSLGSPCGC
jgi:hypothetical protein